MLIAKKNAAIAIAKLDYIQDVASPIAAHPAFWSAFILIGDDQPVKIQKKQNWGSYWYGALALLLLAVTAFGLLKWGSTKK